MNKQLEYLMVTLLTLLISPASAFGSLLTSEDANPHPLVGIDLKTEFNRPQTLDLATTMSCSSAEDMSMDHNPAKEHQHKSHDTKYAYSVGEPVSAAQVMRTVRVAMSDSMSYTFEPSLDHLLSGEVIKFVVTNTGKIDHEFSIGNQADQTKHAEMMQTMKNMDHQDGNTITVAPGATGSITWQFTGNETVVFACNVPGHYQAGMFKKIPIVDSSRPGNNAHQNSDATHRGGPESDHKDEHQHLRASLSLDIGTGKIPTPGS